jgi:hypothetical protein
MAGAATSAAVGRGGEKGQDGGGEKAVLETLRGAPAGITDRGSAGRPARAAQDVRMNGSLRAADFEADFPDHEIIVYRNRAVRSEVFPHGFECLILIPRTRITSENRPFWRHGEVMEVQETR